MKVIPVLLDVERLVSEHGSSRFVEEDLRSVLVDDLVPV